MRTHHVTRHVIALAVISAAACAGGGSAKSDTASSSGSIAPASGSQVMVRGTVSSVSTTQLALSSDSGPVTVTLTQPATVYDRAPGTIADVKAGTFVGVTSVKQPDGSERATEIHVFPEDLRGLGEGSHMMNQNAGSPPNSRMTNGAVSGSQMTNGTASGSRMSNGAVASTNGTTLVVQYSGGSQTITIPPNTPVTVIKATSKALAAGDRVVAVADRSADGTLTTNKVLISNK